MRPTRHCAPPVGLTLPHPNPRVRAPPPFSPIPSCPCSSPAGCVLRDSLHLPRLDSSDQARLLVITTTSPSLLCRPPQPLPTRACACAPLAHWPLPWRLARPVWTSHKETRPLPRPVPSPMHAARVAQPTPASACRSPCAHCPHDGVHAAQAHQLPSRPDRSCPTTLRRAPT
jgi:hypothetical protein